MQDERVSFRHWQLIKKSEVSPYCILIKLSCCRKEEDCFFNQFKLISRTDNSKLRERLDLDHRIKII